MGQPYLDALKKINGIQIDNTDIDYLADGKAIVTCKVYNQYNTDVPGTLNYKITDAAAGKIIKTENVSFLLHPFENKELQITVPHHEGIDIETSFTEKLSGYSINNRKTVPYILTPAVS